MKICIENKIIGHEKHLVFDGKKILQSNSIPDDCWVYNNSENYKNNLKKLFLVNGLKINESPRRNLAWDNVISLLGCEDEYIPWRKFMPKDQWMEYAQNLVSSMWKDLKEIGCEYYENIYCTSQKVLGHLKRCCIDNDVLNQYLSNDKDVNGSLKSFIPLEDGLAGEIKYSRNTLTGRMKIKKGPRILTLKKEYRNIIKSRYENGLIVSIDYISIEPKIALILAGREMKEGDIYQDISNELFNSKISRDITKQLVLSILYGAGKELLSKSTKIENIDLYQYISKIKEYFKVQKITKDLLYEYNELGFIRNFYGKIIRIKDPAPHKLYNAKIQSTAVDAYMLGFSNINFSNIEGADPVAVIHDDILIDVKSSLLDTLKEEMNRMKKIKGFKNNFEAKHDIISENYEESRDKRN